jgi:hypothetical protein
LAKGRNNLKLRGLPSQRSKYEYIPVPRDMPNTLRHHWVAI